MFCVQESEGRRTDSLHLQQEKVWRADRAVFYFLSNPSTKGIAQKKSCSHSCQQQHRSHKSSSYIRGKGFWARPRQSATLQELASMQQRRMVASTTRRPSDDTFGGAASNSTAAIGIGEKPRTVAPGGASYRKNPSQRIALIRTRKRSRQGQCARVAGMLAMATTQAFASTAVEATALDGRSFVRKRLMTVSSNGLKDGVWALGDNLAVEERRLRGGTGDDSRREENGLLATMAEGQEASTRWRSVDAFPGVASDGVPWLESFLTSGRGHSSDFVSPLWRGREEGDLPAGRNPDLSAEGGVDPYRRRLQGVDPEEGGEDPPAGAEGDDGTSVEDDDEDQDGIGGDTTDGIDMVLIIGIVIGSGVVTLIILCIVRKVMDLCLLRNDPTGRIRYSQEEGLSKRSIERLPQTRYKTPAARAQGKASSKEKTSSSQQQGQASAARVNAEVDTLNVRPKASTEASPEAQGGEVVPAVPGGGEIGAGGALGMERDSTEDMCAICLVEYESGDELRIIPGCRHNFHKECIDPWLETKAMCAYCKAKVEAKKTCCDRVFKAASDRLGLNLVAPTTIRFSSSRRTYTNEDVQQAMGPTLPPSYGRSEMDYVGSMVAPASTRDVEEGVGGGVDGVRTGGSESRAHGRTESQGSIFVQPLSSPGFIVPPREFSLGGGEVDTVPGVSQEEKGALEEGKQAESGSAEEKQQTLGTEASTVAPRALNSTRESRRSRRLAAGGSRGVTDGFRGVVFGGDTPEYREAEAQRRAAADARGVASNQPVTSL